MRASLLQACVAAIWIVVGFAACITLGAVVGLMCRLITLGYQFAYGLF